MDKLNDLKLASEEYIEDDPSDAEDQQYVLLKRLEDEGHKTICIGRATVTIERCYNSDSDIPEKTKEHWGGLKINIYSDPDVYPDEEPTCLYLTASKYGFIDSLIQVIKGKETRFV